MKKLLVRFSGVIAFVVVYLLFSGGEIHTQFWFPFIVILVVATGAGNIHLGGKKHPSKESV